MAPCSPPPQLRRPLPQPVEETKRSNRMVLSSAKDRSAETGSPKPRRALPQPVETSSKSSRKQDSHDTSRDPIGITSNTESLPQPIESQSRAPKPRRFAPQIIETTRRSRRNTDTSADVAPPDNPQSLPAHLPHLPSHMRPLRPSAVPIPPDNSPVLSTEQIPQVPPESRFSSSRLAEKAPRRHSFRVPELPAIKSDPETEESIHDSKSPSFSNSPRAGSDPTEARTNKRRRQRESQGRESQDERFTGYLLSLAASAAEKQLREQAMAAYPNENMHEPVDHYAIDRDSEESDVEIGVGKLSMDGSSAGDDGTGRKHAGHKHRESAAGWDLAEMRRHQDRLEQQKRDQWAAESQVDLSRRRSVKEPIHKGSHLAAEAVGAPPKDIVGWQKDNEMKPMRNAASPPMAGESLRFPRCESPRATRLDVHQYPGQRKVAGTQSREHSGLWTPGGGTSRANSTSGLWNGVCAASTVDSLAPPKPLQSGLLTPAPYDRPDPFLSLSDALAPPQTSSQASLSPSPPSSSETTSHRPRRPRNPSLESELSDTFVTQVYNYLSLGYPSLARPFDPELEKITGVAVATIRQDDSSGNSKGYVGAPEGTGPDAREASQGACRRWLALRLYVREWGMQQPEMRVEDVEGGWGARARKGSWAL